jgi:hypothetical protein
MTSGTNYEYIYFFVHKEYDDEVKIGKTSNDTKLRLSNLNVGISTNRLIEHDKIMVLKYLNLEKVIHKHLKSSSKHINGEFFKLTLEELDKLIKNYRRYEINPRMQTILTTIKKSDCKLDDHLPSKIDIVNLYLDLRKRYDIRLVNDHKKENNLVMFDDIEIKEEKLVIDMENSEKELIEVKQELDCSVFKCKICKQIFSTNEDLIKHDMLQ